MEKIKEFWNASNVNKGLVIATVAVVAFVGYKMYNKVV